VTEPKQRTYIQQLVSTVRGPVSAEVWSFIIFFAAIGIANDLLGYPMRFAAPVCLFVVFSGLTIAKFRSEWGMKLVWNGCASVVLYLFLEVAHRLSLR